MSRLIKNVAYIGILLLFSLTAQADEGRILRFIYCSDLHYGLQREFRGHTAGSDEVNRAMFEAFTQLSHTTLPPDGGVGSGTVFGESDFVVCTGDVANRMEDGVQTAAQSWAQFERDFLSRTNTPIYLVPGNHDISNAIGYPLPLTPSTDATSAASIFNQSMYPTEPRTSATFNYDTDRVHYSFVSNSIRFAFIGLWPDRQMRQWLDSVLCADSQTPTLIFTHDPPEADAKHFYNPNGRHHLNASDKFENLLVDTATVRNVRQSPKENWRQLERFIHAHPNIKAYFHGDKNYHEFYTWQGVEGIIRLPVFRVDSPMKGEYSAADEGLLSFMVVTIDTGKRLLTARECLWNNTAGESIEWGEMRTIKL